MHPDKVSGPDGLNPGFFQHFWDLIGKEVFVCCQKWLTDGTFTYGVNDTIVVLIPKKDNVDDPKDLRPIALCNVLYKIVAKVLANRLQKNSHGSYLKSSRRLFLEEISQTTSW